MDSLPETSTASSETSSALEARLDAVHSVLAVAEFDGEGFLRAANERFLAALGQREQDLLGRPHHELRAAAWAKSGEREAFWSALAPDRPQAGTFEFRGANGDAVQLQGSYHMIREDGGTVTLFYANDVTEQIESEALRVRFQSIVNNAPLNIMVADNEGTIEYINPKSFETLAKIEHLLPVPVDRIQGESFDKFHKNPQHQRDLVKDDSRLPVKTRIKLGDETLNLFATAMYGTDGNYAGPMLTWDIVTEQVAQEAELAEAREREEARTESLEQRVEQMLSVVTAAAAGDLTQQVEIAGDDAVASMGEGLNQLISSLRQSIEGISDNATTLAAASEELTATSQQMHTNSEQTNSRSGVAFEACKCVAVNVQTVASGTEELNESIKEIAVNASRAAGIAGDAVTVADETNRAVSKLGESSQEIGQVIKVITSIAQQTNLLALNATIEAARAGDAGKGFAVVANEVKELAKETAKATGDISQKIEAIQGDTLESVSAIERISGIIGQINDIQGTIAAAVEEQTATTTQMSRSVADANDGTQEIVRNIDGVTVAAKETSAGASGVQSAAAELSMMANDLQGMVTRFKF